MGANSSTESSSSGNSFRRRESWNQQRSYPPPPPQSQPPSTTGSDYVGYSQPYPAYGYTYPPPPSQPPQGYPPPPHHQTSTSSSSPNPPRQQRPRLDRRFSQIADNYRSLDQVSDALAQAGLESSNLIVGIDFTKSNEWTGKYSFNGRSLHHIGEGYNPYEQAISIVGRTLSVFDEDNLIPCFGFGDASTHDQDVFTFFPDGRPCNGFTEALTRYREIVPQLRLAGPTSFAPIIEMAMTIVEQSGGQYHVLLIIADGQVTRSVDTEHGKLSSQEQKTVDAIVKASEFPLSIILVGVGDGPWDMMKEFDDNIPARAFDNFQFVNFTEIMSKNAPPTKKETEFALSALMEIPPQYKATIELGILGKRTAKSPERVPLPPPIGSSGTSFMGAKSFGSAGYPQQKASYYPDYKTPASNAPPDPTSFYPDYKSPESSAPPYPDYKSPESSAPPYPDYKAPESTVPHPASLDDQLCPICLTNPKNMAFGCGHQTCYECGPGLKSCPICRSEIVTRIRLY